MQFVAACHYAPSCVEFACRNTSPKLGSMWLLVYGPACLWDFQQRVSAFEARLHCLKTVQDHEIKLRTLTEQRQLKSKMQPAGRFRHSPISC